MKNFELYPPLKHILLTQPFGVNWLDFYKKLGMKGHNGLDFRIRENPKVYAAHAGTVTWSGEDSCGGVSVEIVNTFEKEGFKTIYYHLKKTLVKKGDEVKILQTIGLADNTGKYTTGGHLHFGLKKTYNGCTLNKDNGYCGAIDPTDYFIKDGLKTPAAKRYGRKRTWDFYQLEIKNASFLTRYLRRIPTWEQINAVTYGYWDKETIANIGMAYLYKYLTKIEYQSGRRPFV